MNLVRVDLETDDLEKGFGCAIDDFDDSLFSVLGYEEDRADYYPLSFFRDEELLRIEEENRGLFVDDKFSMADHYYRLYDQEGDTTNMTESGDTYDPAVGPNSTAYNIE